MKKEVKILIVGAGEAGQMLLEEYKRRGKSSTIIGFVDDDAQKIGSIIAGKSVLNSTDKIDDVVTGYDVNQIIIAMPSAPHGVINNIIDKIINADPGINIHIIPAIEKYFESVPLSPALQDITITDIIGREEYTIDTPVIEEKFYGKTILITGAGGSIGSEICRQLLKFKIKKIIAIGRGEFSIYNLIKSLNDYLEYMDHKPEVVYRIADVKDYLLMSQIFDEYKPDIVFHAAAHKHVPLMEYNVIEAIKNNAGGTFNILELSKNKNVDEFILISTDKAVNPTNVMGATKRIAEIITSYYFKEKKLKTAIVRFGNVIGSRGSVIPLFREQIEKGGPVTVTDPGMKRYFMSIPEASLLVINAAAYSNGGELFILDMGKQYKLIDIARRMIELYGYVPEKEIKIKISGLRPGEKLFEELYYSNEKMVETDNKMIFMLRTGNYKIEKIIVEDFINNKLPNIHDYNTLQIKKIMKDLIPEYDYNELDEPPLKPNKLIN